MEMAELMKMIRLRQGGKSIEEYANMMGIRGATLFRYYNEDREVSLEVVRKLARFYNQHGDTEMLEALSSYALGLDLSASSSN